MQNRSEIRKIGVVFRGVPGKAGDRVLQGVTQVLDDTKKPKTVDATVTEGRGKGTTVLAIYERDWDTLKAWCDIQGKKRPTEFKTAAGSGACWW